MTNLIIKTAIILDNILKQGDIRLVDEFEEEFMKLEYKKETTVMIIYGNRDVIRKVFQLVVLTKGSDATLYDIQNCLHNTNGLGRKLAIMASKKKGSEQENEKRERLAYYFLEEFFKYNNGDFEYSRPLRYIIDKIIDTCENKNYNLKRENCNDAKIEDNVEGDETISINQNILSKITKQKTEEKIDIFEVDAVKESKNVDLTKESIIVEDFLIFEPNEFEHDDIF